jgi:hypothetical protein
LLLPEHTKRKRQASVRDCTKSARRRFRTQDVSYLERHLTTRPHETWGVHVQCTSSECQGYEKWDKKLDSHAAEKGAKKLVSINFAKILEEATKIRETCEKTLITPPSPIKATNSIVSV